MKEEKGKNLATVAVARFFICLWYISFDVFNDAGYKQHYDNPGNRDKNHFDYHSKDSYQDIFTPT